MIVIDPKTPSVNTLSNQKIKKYYGKIITPIEMDFRFYPNFEHIQKLNICAKPSDSDVKIGKFFWISKADKRLRTVGIMDENMIKKYIARKLIKLGYNCDYNLANILYKILKPICDSALELNYNLFGKNLINPSTISNFDDYFNCVYSKPIYHELIDIFHEISNGDNFQYRYITEHD